MDQAGEKGAPSIPGFGVMAALFKAGSYFEAHKGDASAQPSLKEWMLCAGFVPQVLMLP